MRAGLLLCALAGVLAVLSPGNALVEGRAAGPGQGLRTLEPDSALITTVGVAAVVLLGLAAALPFLWVHLGGIALASAFAYLCGGTVAIARTSADFASGSAISLERGGLLLVAAFWLALVGVAVALIGIRAYAVARERDEGEREPGQRGAAGPPRTSPRAIAALALGIGGVLTVASAALAIALGILALSDIRLSGGRLGGRGLALGGIVLGVVVLSLLTAIVGVGSLAATPT